MIKPEVNPISDPATADLWLFGYGSLIWKADFGFAERKPAMLSGWERRFWQGSHDHRGTQEHPGRVVTLIRAPHAECLGMAYRIEGSKVQAVLEHLDFREKNGYERFDEPISFVDGSANSGLSALVYVATPDNFAHLGPASDLEIAQQIHRSIGPSGTKLEYLLELHNALVELGADDPHIATLVDLVLKIG